MAPRILPADLGFFSALAMAGSLSAAAREMHVTTAAVSKRFAAAVRAVAPEATGLAVSMQESSATIQRAFLQSGLLGLVFVLQAVSHSMLLVTDESRSLGLAPLHALTMGFMGATLIAMATRVSAGHSGRHLVADNLVWTLFWVQQVATVLRVTAACWPGAPSWLTSVAASLWALATVSWAVRYGRWYGRPRTDGAPG